MQVSNILGFARGNSARGLKASALGDVEMACEGRFSEPSEQVKKALQYLFAKHLMHPVESFKLSI